MFGRVRAVESDIGHREALSLAQRKETERNQQAILRLLDELAPLADGDLTVQATVTEDITGTIADSINYAIGVLRDLVSHHQPVGHPARRRHPADAGAVRASREGIERAVEADRRRHRIRQQHGEQHRSHLG